eukprot:GHVU01180987.1.p2 GENE.GHVU01180987.1~~GHVU01180987.1.p2  ORF type:complete len:119 (+),score=16.41 GHVU01180987.1:643-999(+)
MHLRVRVCVKEGSVVASLKRQFVAVQRSDFPKKDDGSGAYTGRGCVAGSERSLPAVCACLCVWVAGKTGTGMERQRGRLREGEGGREREREGGRVRGNARESERRGEGEKETMIQREK